MTVIMSVMMISQDAVSAAAIPEDCTQQAAEAFLEPESRPVGGILEPVSFSEEEISACEVSEEELLAYAGVSEEAQAEAEQELTADLMRLQAECVSANGCLPAEENASLQEQSVSGNAADVIQNGMVEPQQLGYATIADAASYLRKQMVQRKSYITLRLAKGNDSSQRAIKKILTQSMAYEEDGSPSEGDYLYWNFMAYRWTLAKATNETVTYKIAVAWRTTAAQEKYVSQKVAQIIRELSLQNPQKSDYEKVRLIYHYIMEHVDYDYEHYRTNQKYMPMYTVYAALHDGKGVCQAYSLLFYRLCREVGISARLIAGNDVNGAPTHGWNIVRIGEIYYNLDATWDDETASKTVYFLKNQADFSGHTRNKEYATAAFEKQFPTATVSYRLPDTKDVTASSKYEEKENITGSFVTTAGTAFSVQSQGTYKILFFLNSMEKGSKNALDLMARWKCLGSASCEIALVDVLSDEAYADYMNANQITGVSVADFEKLIAERALKYLGNPSNVVYVLPSEAGRNMQAQYAKLMGGTAGAICSGVLIDPANKVRFWCEGGLQVSGLQNAMYELMQKDGNFVSAGQLQLLQSANDKVTVSWKAVSGAQRYYVYRKNGAGDYACVGTTTNTSYVNTIPRTDRYAYLVYASDGTDFFAAFEEEEISCKSMLPQKGKTYQIDGNKYKILKSTASAQTVAFTGITSKSRTFVRIPDSVKIDGLTYKVTEISAGALRNQTKVKTVSIGKNVNKLGKQAFYGCKKLVQIVVQGKKIKSVGKAAFGKTAGYVNVYVPKSMLKKYKKLFAGKGLSANAKIRK